MIFVSNDLRQLRYFVAVAQELHFGRAAARLRIAQPALSIQIRNLERTLGVRLFDRTNRSVELTQAGSFLLRDARRIIAEMEQAVDRVRRAGAGEIGRIEVGYTGSAACAGVLSRSLRAFRKGFPNIELRVHELDSALQIEHLRDGRLDVGFVTRPSAATLPPGFAARRVATIPLVLALARDHPFAARSNLMLADLVEEEFVVHTGSHDEFGRSLVQRLGGFEPSVSHPCGSAVSVITLVAAGLGVALVPASLEAIGLEAAVVYRPLSDIGEHLAIDLVHDTGNAKPAGVNFVQLFRRSPDDGPRMRA